MSKITKVIFKNFKGISTEQALTGMDIFVGPTGVGKTTRLDALTVGMLGCLPSLGKRPMDTVELASDKTMSVSLSTTTGFSLSRLFDTNPVAQTINVFPTFGEKNNTQCEARIVEELGDFPVMWNLGEFMGLSDDKKRAFIFDLVKVDADKWNKKAVSDSLVGQADKWVNEVLSCWKEDSNIQTNLSNMLIFLKNQLSQFEKKKKDGEGATRKMAELKTECVSSEVIAETKRIIAEIQEGLTKIREQVAADKVKVENARQRGISIVRLQEKLKQFSPDILSATMQDLIKDLERVEKLYKQKTIELDILERNVMGLSAQAMEKENILKRLEGQRGMCPVLKDFKCGQDFSTVKQDAQNELSPLAEALILKRKVAVPLKEEVLELLKTTQKHEKGISDKKSIAMVQEELAVLQKQESVNEGVADPDILNVQRIGLESRLTEKKAELEKKEEVKRNLLIVSQLALSSDDAEENIETIKALLLTLGTKGLQGEIVRDSVDPIFDKANFLLSQINATWNIGTRFADNKGQEIFQIGWKKEDGWVPFTTLSSGQKVIFSTALMAALVLTRNPACKILGIELGECDNACSKMLIEGLDKIAAQMDNIIVCSWHDVESPEGWKKWNL